MKHFEYSKKAQKTMRVLPRTVYVRIRNKVREYAKSPELYGNWVKSVAGHSETYRLRVGRYRVVFTETNDLIFITKIGHRKDVYDNL